MCVTTDTQHVHLGHQLTKLGQFCTPEVPTESIPHLARFKAVIKSLEDVDDDIEKENICITGINKIPRIASVIRISINVNPLL